LSEAVLHVDYGFGYHAFRNLKELFFVKAIGASERNGAGSDDDWLVWLEEVDLRYWNDYYYYCCSTIVKNWRSVWSVGILSKTVVDLTGVSLEFLGLAGMKMKWRDCLCCP
jgi:hypothetical protein